MREVILFPVGILIFLIGYFLIPLCPDRSRSLPPPRAPELIGLLVLDENGKITQSLHEPTGNHLREITSAREYGGSPLPGQSAQRPDWQVQTTGIGPASKTLT